MNISRSCFSNDILKKKNVSNSTVFILNLCEPVAFLTLNYAYLWKYYPEK